jgi:WD40 repeat protein
VNRVNRAYRELEDDNVALAEDLLHGCPAERRGWDWNYVKRLCTSRRFNLDLGASVNAVPYSPDGSWFASASGSQYVGAAPSEGQEATGARRQILGGIKGCILGIAISLDGRGIAVGSGFSAPRAEGCLSVWDVASGQAVWSVSEPRF